MTVQSVRSRASFSKGPSDFESYARALDLLEDVDVHGIRNWV
eukprot:CAMPEP_0198338094 /NCGR_PEP_ID=MMETSP1450-20131203/32936_1 /TAXON_ID=753684 ORGANISM="Madagascaria erythrocladiodes, Strain CCMP3234" /NCGR_SAMPLE_ID=MMETSP1450 /ASSEMBLY_ACC=CAM_ASM_001115 /LENGTH=41 /DNA_ID= /DNA_START= /DNA_END= /DNA_ORIENTATION=